MLHNIIELQSRALVTLVNTMPNKEIIKTHQPGSEGQVGVQERTTLDNFGQLWTQVVSHTHTHTCLGTAGARGKPGDLGPFGTEPTPVVFVRLLL